MKRKEVSRMECQPMWNIMRLQSQAIFFSCYGIPNVWNSTPWCYLFSSKYLQGNFNNVMDTRWPYITRALMFFTFVDERDVSVEELRVTLCKYLPGNDWLFGIDLMSCFSREITIGIKWRSGMVTKILMRSISGFVWLRLTYWLMINGSGVLWIVCGRWGFKYRNKY